jgi:hypothetical protein
MPQLSAHRRAVRRRGERTDGVQRAAKGEVAGPLAPHGPHIVAEPEELLDVLARGVPFRFVEFVEDDE